ncbi:MAG: pyrroline-5-carboxylate reductase [Rhodospirillales bacterium]
MTQHPTLLLVGGGKMGGAMLRGWLDRGLPAGNVRIVEPANTLRDQLASDFGVDTVPSADHLSAAFSPDFVILAVKPQVMESVTPDYQRFAVTGCAFLSIAAGKSIASFERSLGNEAAIIRAMPNTPAAVGRGMTVCVANSHVDDGQRTTASSLLEAVGEVAWVEDEAMIDAVTAISGSGPAYVFLLTESLAKAGEEAGLPADLARQLARATVCGAGELMHQASDEPEILRQNVTSPGGTTAAALAVLMDQNSGWQDIISRAVEAAANRSRELA